MQLSSNMDKLPTEVVLITGGSGFLGQNLVKLLQECDPLVKEIRILDLNEYENKIGHEETKKVTSFVGDICEPTEEVIGKAFEGVDCVFHCAAFINFQFPPNLRELERVNVEGTKNVINLCLAHNVRKLVFTSTSAVTLIPYMGSTMAVIVNQTEAKAKTATVDSAFLIPGYPSSKLRAEKLVCAADGAILHNGKDCLRTLALRPTVLYGEGDERFFPTLLKVGHKFGGQLPKIFGVGGKQQLTYVGNAAWAHICAKNALNENGAKIGGLPIFITDDTACVDTFRFAQRISSASPSGPTISKRAQIRLRPTWWSIPAFLTYMVAMLVEFIIRIISPFLDIRIDVPPRGLVSYLTSMFIYNRLRSSLTIDYEPRFNEKQALLDSTAWYERWNEAYLNRLDKERLNSGRGN